MKKYISRTSILFSLVLALVIAVNFSVVAPARALPVEVTANFPQITKDILQKAWDGVLKAGKISFFNVLRSAVNQFAFDTATYVGSGGEGQKPVYFTKEFGAWLRDQGANAGGQFIEEFVRTQQTSPDALFSKFDICAPDFSATARISLGLSDFLNKNNTSGIASSRCNLKKIFDAYSNQVDLVTSPDYLRNIGLTAFDTQSTDVGAAFSLFGNAIDTQIKVTKEEELNRAESKGYADPKYTISKEKVSPPGTTERQLAQSADLQTQTFFTQTGDIFVDAAHIFLNQFALTAFNKLIKSLSKDSGSGSDPATDFYAQNQRVGGVSAVSRRATTLLQAKFSDKTDYDILSELSSCSDESKPGPTNCVITPQFADAVNQRLSVAEAVNRGVIDSKKRLGFNSQGGDLSYKDGYPYRSLIILRKFRILPVGWEVAAQYLKDHAEETNNVTLGDLINCFAPNDSYSGFSAPWCEGLIDPNWILKVPKQYCGMEGYGPEILQAQATTSTIGYCARSDSNCSTNVSGNDTKCETNNVACFADEGCASFAPFTKCNTTVGRQTQVTRNSNYCADEQSCIKENPNGSCAYYGYCTEEKRSWAFGSNQEDSCEARNNTCQTFQSASGQTASYLQNTLSYKDCNANQVGCKQYSVNGTYNQTSKTIAWTTAGSAYFNKNISECEASGEGCHQFIRTKNDLDGNLIADGSFEGLSCATAQGISDADSSPKALNPLVASASAQTAFSLCVTTNFPASGYVPNANNRWYIRLNGTTPVKAGVLNDQADHGSQSLYIEGNGGIYSKDSSAPTLLPAGFTMEADQYYTLSARVFVVAGKARLGFGANAGQYVESTATNAWQSLVLQYYNPASSPAHDFFIQATDGTAKFYVDSVKFSPGRATTAYSDYLAGNVIYEKLLPSYLESACYENLGGGEPSGSETGDGPAVAGADFRLKANAPAECYKFARKCNANEVGCESYTALNSNIQVTGKVKTKDTCSGSCVGYDTFVKQANSFNAKATAYFIPNSARSCSAQSVGCTAFTNLDKMGQGGEAVEYYTDMRTCMKPDTAQCGEFYTWEGSDEAGYQLRSFSLKKAQGREGEEPASTLSPDVEARLCNADIFKKLPSDPGYNYDCREFYSRDGTVSYHLYHKTISCSDDCHPYRREVASADECTAGEGQWDATQNRCLYYAISGEGTTCSAQQVGCQEYTGNIANNVKTVMNDTFEDASNPPNDWYGGSKRNESLQLAGHSLFGTGISKIVGTSVRRNASYTISFLAKAASAGTLINNVSLANNAGVKADFATANTSFKTDWQLYTFNLSSLDHDVSAKAAVTGEPIEGDGPIGGFTGETLSIAFSGPVYIDNIRLTEIPSRYYLIENSWNTPAECNQDPFGNPADRYMLGCSQYRKADNSTVNLRSFSELCQDSAAGCEAMIDTKNSGDYRKKIVNDVNNNGQCDAGETSCMVTAADTMINVAYDRTKQCGADQKSCQRVALTTTYNDRPAYSDMYIKNDPDQYSSIICSAAGVGCSQWSDGRGGTYYFKDPGDQVCEWRQQRGKVEYSWFEKEIKRCGGTAAGSVCSADSQCASGQTCAVANLDKKCSTTDGKTLGTGGVAGKAIQPKDWAGTCDAVQSGCTEYIDPVSSFNANVIRNSNYATVDNWTVAQDNFPGPKTGKAYQSITLDWNTTYIFKGNEGCSGSACTSADEAYLNNCQLGTKGQGTLASVYELKASTNTFEKNENGSTSATRGKDQSGEFYLSSETATSATVATCWFWRGNTTIASAGNAKTVALRKATVAYQLEQNLDKDTPTGLANFNKGYVLFNERKQSGSVKSALRYNADATGDGGIDGVTPSGAAPLNANQLIKVNPDRTCSKWLDCSSYIPDPNDPKKQTCLQVGLCDSLNSEGRCDHFIQPATDVNQDVKNLSLAGIANMTGYSKVGYRQELAPSYEEDNSGGLTLVSTLSDYYNLGIMREGGAKVSIPNGDFEVGNSGWGPATANPLKILLQAPELQRENLVPSHVTKSSARDSAAYLPPVGGGLGKLSADTKVDSRAPLSMTPNTQYVISGYLYAKGGEVNVTLTYKVGSATNSLLLLKTEQDERDQWLLKTKSFKTPANASNFKLQLGSNSGDGYFDDIRIESGLNTRCADPDKNSTECQQPSYTASTCRLYPTEDALSCQQTDSNNVIHRGIRGYCLETDPKDSNTCLLWYPLDKVASDQDSEENMDLNLPENMLYCLQTTAYCPSVKSGSPSPVTNNLEWPGVSNPRRGVNYDLDIGAYDTYGAASSYAGNNNNYGQQLFTPNANGEGPDKPVYMCTVIAKVDSQKYWRTRLVNGSNYYLDYGMIKNIHFNSQVGGGTVAPVYKSNDYFSSLKNLESTGLIANQPVKFKTSDDLTFGSPFTTQAPAGTIDLTCKGLLHTRDDSDDGTCNGHLAGALGQWENCAATVTAQGGNGCNGAGQYHSTTTWDATAKTWNAYTSDHMSPDDGDQPEADFKCMSKATVTSNGSSAPNPVRDILGTLFVKSEPSYIWNGTSYQQTSQSAALAIPDAACGTLASSSQIGYCTGDPNLSCDPRRSDALGDGKCSSAGKGVCFRKRDAVAKSSDYYWAKQYCYIAPRAFDFKVNNKVSSSPSDPITVNGRSDTLFTFTTKTDPDQLPLKEIIVKLDYVDPDSPIGEEAKTGLSGGNYNDAIRYFKKNLSYANITREDANRLPGPNQKCTTANSSVNGGTCGSKACCILKPRVAVKDNWERFNGNNGIEFNGYIRVEAE